MTKGWQIVVSTDRPGGRVPLIEHFIVAVANRDKAVGWLMERKRLPDHAKILAFGEAPEQTMAFLNAKRGEIYAVSVVM